MRKLTYLLDGGNVDTDTDKAEQDRILEILASGRSEARHIKVLKLLNGKRKGKRGKDDRDTDKCSHSAIRDCNGSSVIGRRIV